MSDFDTAYWDSLYAADPGEDIEPPPEDEPAQPTPDFGDDHDPAKIVTADDLPEWAQESMRMDKEPMRVGNPIDPPTAPQDTPQADSADLPDSLGDDVFGSTRQLQHIRTAARSKLVSDWAVLGLVLARVVAEVPPHVVLPGIIGSEASLNMAHAIVSLSGGGKSGAEGCAEDLLRIRKPLAQWISRGSGEAIIQSFLEYDKESQKNQLVQDPLRICSVDEVTSITAMMGRSSQSTFLSDLRSMISGTRVGTSSVESGRTRMLPRNSYRLVITTGMQPTTAGVLIDDNGAGTPQRFVWWAATDRYDGPIPAWPGKLEWDWQAPRGDPLDGLVRVPVCDKATAEIIAARRSVTRGEGDPLDGHRLLTQEKVATALSILHGELAVSEFWWALAAKIMQHSTSQRTLCVDAIQEVKADEARELGRLQVAREVGARSAREADNLKWATALWKTVAAGKHGNQRHDTDEGCTGRCLTYALRHCRGADKEAAVKVAIENGWILRNGGRYWPGPSRPAEPEAQAA